MPRTKQRVADELPSEYYQAVTHAEAGRYKEALLAFDAAIRSQPDELRIRKARASVLKKLFGKIATGGKNAWLYGRPRVLTRLSSLSVVHPYLMPSLKDRGGDRLNG